MINLVMELVCSSTGRKVDDPEMLEAIRLTIINNLLQYHPVTYFLCLRYYRVKLHVKELPN